MGIGLQWAALQHTVPVASAGSAHGPLPPKGIVTQFISTQIHITDLLTDLSINWHISSKRCR